MSSNNKQNRLTVALSVTDQSIFYSSRLYNTANTTVWLHSGSLTVLKSSNQFVKGHFIYFCFSFISSLLVLLWSPKFHCQWDDYWSEPTPPPWWCTVFSVVFLGTVSLKVILRSCLGCCRPYLGTHRFVGAVRVHEAGWRAMSTYGAIDDVISQCQLPSIAEVICSHGMSFVGHPRGVYRIHYPVCDAINSHIDRRPTVLWKRPTGCNAVPGYSRSTTAWYIMRTTLWVAATIRN